MCSAFIQDCNVEIIFMQNLFLEIKKEILTPWLKAQVEEKLRKKLCVLASENASDTSSSNAANTSNLLQNTLDKFLMKIVELFNKLNIKDSSRLH